MKTESAPPNSGFAEVRQQINAWRETRTSRGWMSKDLWSSAALLAKEHGVWKTSQILGLSYGSLKKHVLSSDGVQTSTAAVGATVPRSGFVEMETSEFFGGSTTSEMLVEISTKDGAKLSIRFGAGSAVDVPALVSAFRQRVR